MCIIVSFSILIGYIGYIYLKWNEVLVTNICLTLCDPMDCSPTRLFSPWDFPGNNTGVGCHALLQGIFPTQGSNLGLLHCRWILYCLSHQVRYLKRSIYIYTYIYTHIHMYIYIHIHKHLYIHIHTYIHI